jgi:hypothetical protein
MEGNFAHRRAPMPRYAFNVDAPIGRIANLGANASNHVNAPLDQTIVAILWICAGIHAHEGQGMMPRMQSGGYSGISCSGRVRRHQAVFAVLEGRDDG